MSNPLIELSGVKKSFGPVEVLKGVDLKVYPGRVTALVGDNGAGKSTLIKGLAGVQWYDEGSVKFEGKEVSLTTPRISSALGVEVVYQDLALCENLDIVQNMFLGREELYQFTLDESAMEFENLPVSTLSLSLSLTEYRNCTEEIQQILKSKNNLCPNNNYIQDPELIKDLKKDYYNYIDNRTIEGTYDVINLADKEEKLAKVKKSDWLSFISVSYLRITNPFELNVIFNLNKINFLISDRRKFRKLSKK